MNAYTIRIDYRVMGDNRSGLRKVRADNAFAARTTALKNFTGSHSDRFMVTGSSVIAVEAA